MNNTDDLQEHGVGAASEPEASETTSPTQIEPVQEGPPDRPAPPRRTGVFLDPQDLREHVGGLLRAMLGGYEVDAFGNFTFQHEQARIFVTFGVSPVGPTVGVFSITNLDVDFTAELAAFLLTANHRMSFGAFSYERENRAIWLKHTLLGTMLDGPELQATLMSVANTAAQVDDKIRDEFGGRAFHDAPAEEQQRTRPPEPAPGGDAVETTNASGYL